MSANIKHQNKNVAVEAKEESRPVHRGFERAGPLSFQGCPPDKVMRVFNDIRNRIHQAQQMGWQFVSKDWISSNEKTLQSASEIGSAKTMPVDFDVRTGKPIIGYLMMMDRTLYEENQKYKQDELDERMSQLAENQKNSVPGSYVPK